MKDNRIIALDIGEKRIGVASANSDIGFPTPLTTIQNDNKVWKNLSELFSEHNVKHIVVGLPRNLQGDDTQQTEFTRKFVKKLKEFCKLPIDLQDEALTSIKAEHELTTKKKPFNKGDIDALAATYILEDYLQQEGIRNVS